MPTEMRGLNQYIADLRACRVRELEEKRINKEMANIRQKFKDGNLDGYSKKKYLAKIVFTYILGYPVDIGHMEAVNLISSTKYSEKQIGYLALTLLMHENSDLIRLVINSIRKDLDAHNETNNCLALQAIANIGGKEMSESLLHDVYSLLISPLSNSFVKKKAALTLLRMYRKNPEVFPISDWALRIVSLMVDSDMGVCLAVTSLVLTLAQDHLQDFAICYQKAVDKLYNVIVDLCTPSEYIYYRVPIPWLQCKLLRLLQYYPPTEDTAVAGTLQIVLTTILDIAHEIPKNVQHSNAQNAVLFEAINLAIHLDPNSELVSRSSVLLAGFILSKETNVRYLGLDTMSHLAARSDDLTVLKKHQDTIILSLRDKDISVRRRGLDLLYSMCDSTNAKVIVGELLRYLGISDYTLREELVLKIAILTEKFATEYEWYLNTILKLMNTAGEHISDEVWYRVIQIVTNTEELQEYAMQKVFEYIHLPVCHEQMIKLAAYIMGEFGHLVANNEGLSPIEQFQVLHSKANQCSTSTRAMLLTTYLKWLNLFPEIRTQILEVFEKYSHVLDAELQQRACEYLALAQLPDEDLLQTVCDEMPPFPERESTLLNRLTKTQGETGDKRTWVIGGKEANKAKEENRLQGVPRKNRTSMLPSPGQIPLLPVASSSTSGVANANGAVDQLAQDLNGLELETKSNAVERAEPLASSVFTPGTEKQLTRLSYLSEGVLYEDVQLQIGLKSEYHGDHGQLTLYFGNKITAPFESLTLVVESDDPQALYISLPRIPTNKIEPMTQIEQRVLVECKGPFGRLPVLKVSYLAGSLQTFTIRLPIYLTKFVEPIQLNATTFFERWKQIGGPPREQQEIFKIKKTEDGELMKSRKMAQLVAGMKLNILEQVDPNPNNLVGAGVLNTSASGKVGCLMRLEPNEKAQLARITIRTTNDLVSAELIKIIIQPLKEG
ncbi:hypothetical protein PTTG_09491 [Puccinia triticina 1-1 BBBD Race 1]|uniref:AP-2 complex subunit alpha n=2 Tax=Puccinia triticina TaxID=208348 RepID=A0A180G444_PUCT1|nr:uncharacterized protein PtA15_5A389 [Puccinia triticina]OAV87414.1 hypothetical protein PTTG_09491 [Puccinia triticina 1-1 BBBD Race 1]WAQ84816.1 hypothetical protein PtA15_5A389 [Puccinia triticina]WAR58159.1 hypothetical protein PtB15_5B391 [Puccinia triticina]